jgi:hypothetical protein
MATFLFSSLGSFSGIQTLHMLGRRSRNKSGKWPRLQPPHGSCRRLFF